MSTHTVMPKKLAQALMDASMQHFDAGGLVGLLGVGNNFQASQPADAQIQQQYGQQQDVYNQQQSLANQLLAQTQGGGPGNALIQQQVGKNAAQQAATQASVRGASANPALVARNAAAATAQGQQQAMGAQANMELQSQGALANQQSQMANQALQSQSTLWGATTGANNINAQVAGQNAKANQGIMGGLIGGAAGALLGGFGLAHGGKVPKMSVGGPVNDQLGIENFGTPDLGLMAGASSKGVGDAFSQGQKLGSGLGGGGGQSDADAMEGYLDADAMLGGGAETMLPAAADVAVMAAAKGGKIPFGQMLAGGNVPGKAKFKGDSPKNDIVPTMLSPGEEVIPRSIAQMPESSLKDKKVLEFMHHLKGKKKGGYAQVAKLRRTK